MIGVPKPRLAQLGTPQLGVRLYTQKPSAKGRPYCPPVPTCTNHHRFSKKIGTWSDAAIYPASDAAMELRARIGVRRPEPNHKRVL